MGIASKRLLNTRKLSPVPPISPIIYQIRHMASNSSSTPFSPLTNVLKNAKSPYLLQHKDNPVAWQEFTSSTIQLAQSLNRPIFLSSGYSSCHWCHVLAHESFEDPDVADIMNRYFINIKVDREERPDIDKLYMTYLQMTQGGGGWPLSVFMTPNLEPFFAGTYFPRPQFKALLIRIQELWEEDQQKCEEMGSRMIDALRQIANPTETTSSSSSQMNSPDLLYATLTHLLKNYDPRYGGFSSSGPRSNGPKFPSFSLTLEPLARIATMNKMESCDDAQSKSPVSWEPGSGRGVTIDGGKEAMKMGIKTLRAMWEGGIRDWVGGGMARYSVDERWIVPHFEKMLYDQAQLISIALDFARLPNLTPIDKSLCLSLASDTLIYTLRDLLSNSGGFYSSEDADSEPGPPGSSRKGLKKKEGAFYVWDKNEVDEVVGVHDADLVTFFFGLKIDGNVNPRHDSHGQMTGKNILYQARSLEETAEKFGLTEQEVGKKVTRACEALKKWRDETRERPGLDDKILTSWNGLMLSALAKASVTLTGDLATDAKEAAEGIVKFIQNEVWDEPTRTLYRSYRDGRGPPGQTDDYAFLIQGLLDLYHTTGDDRLVSFAVKLQKRQDELFWDQEGGGYFTSAPDPYVPVRLKDEQDGAEPCATSISLRNLSRLELLASINFEEYKTKFEKTVGSLASQLEKQPFAFGAAVSALIDRDRGYREYIFTGSEEFTNPLLSEIHTLYSPNTVLIRLDPSQPPREMAKLNPVVKALLEEGAEVKAGLRVCENGSCSLVALDLEEASRMIRGLYLL